MKWIIWACMILSAGTFGFMAGWLFGYLGLFLSLPNGVLIGIIGSFAASFFGDDK